MAEIQLFFMDADGFPTEHDPNADSITLNGLTMTGNVAMGGNLITGLADGVSNTDAVTLQQLTAVQEQLTWKDPVRLKSIGDLGATFAAGGGANSLGQFTGAPTTVDGVAVAAGDRILVSQQTAGLENGIYVVTATTSTWDRAGDFDETTEVVDGSTVWVREGSTCADSRWTLTTNDPITVNTTALVWVQTSGAGSLTAGDGIVIAGNTVSVDLSATPGLQFNGGDLEVLVDPAGAILLGAGGIAASVDGTTIGINGSNQLEVLGAGKSTQVGPEYTVAAGGVTIGDPVYFTANDTIGPADASNQNARRVVGLAEATTAAAGTTCVISEGVLAGAITGATAGDFVYLAVGGGLTTTVPAKPNYVDLVGYAINATDVYIHEQFMGKKVL